MLMQLGQNLVHTRGPTLHVRDQTRNGRVFPGLDTCRDRRVDVHEFARDSTCLRICWSMSRSSMTRLALNSVRSKVFCRTGTTMAPTPRTVRRRSEICVAHPSIDAASTPSECS